MRFFVYGASLEMNFGGPSIFSGLTTLLQQNFDDCHITYLDRFPAANVSDTRRSPRSTSGVDVFFSRGMKPESFIRAAAKQRLGRAQTPTQLNRPIIDAFLSADAVVNAFGIDFCDKLARSGSRISRTVLTDPAIVAARLLGKRTAHYTASYGPFLKGGSSKTAAKLYLGHLYDIVLCREESSAKLLRGIGIRRELILAPDTGLLMDARSFDITAYGFNKQPVVGVSISHQIERQWRATTPYPEFIGRLCDHMINRWNVNIVLLPNELALSDRDDVAVAQDIRAALRSPNRATVFPSASHSAEEQKYLVSKMDMLVASRYHSLVAGLSSRVPTIVLGWHHKYTDLLDTFDQQDMYVDASDGNWNQLVNIADKTWERRGQVRGILESRWPAVRELTIGAGAKFAQGIPRAPNR